MNRYDENINLRKKIMKILENLKNLLFYLKLTFEF